MTTQKQTAGLKSHANRFGSFGLIPIDSTITGDMAEVASARTKEWADEITKRFNEHAALCAVAEAAETAKKLLAIDSDTIKPALQSPEVVEARTMLRQALSALATIRNS